MADIVRFLRTNKEHKAVTEEYLRQILPPEPPLSSRLKSLYACKYCEKCNVLQGIRGQTQGSSCTYCYNKCCRCGREYWGVVDRDSDSDSDLLSDDSRDSDLLSDDSRDSYSDHDKNYDEDLIPRPAGYLEARRVEMERVKLEKQKEARKMAERYTRTRPHYGLCKKCSD